MPIESGAVATDVPAGSDADDRVSNTESPSFPEAIRTRTYTDGSLDKGVLIASNANGYAYLAADKTLYTWGENSDYGLGNPEREDAYAPVKIAENVRWADYVTFCYTDMGDAVKMLIYITDDNRLHTAGCLPMDRGSNDESFFGPVLSPLDEIDFAVTGPESALFLYTMQGELFYWRYTYDNAIYSGPDDGSAYTYMKWLNDSRVNGNVRDISVSGRTACIITYDDVLYCFDLQTQQLVEVCGDVISAKVTEGPGIYVLKKDKSIYYAKCMGEDWNFKNEITPDTLILSNVEAMDYVDLGWDKGTKHALVALTTDGSVVYRRVGLDSAYEVLDAAADIVSVYAGIGYAVYINNAGEAYCVNVADKTAVLITDNAVSAKVFPKDNGIMVLKADGTVVVYTPQGSSCSYLGLGYGINTAETPAALAFEP